MAEPIITAYKLDELTSLQDLENSLQRDEADLTAKIVSLELATDDGVDVTAGTFKEVDDIDSVGNLLVEQYKTNVDIQSLKAIHKTLGEPIVKGEAYINSKPVKVLVFRQKPKPKPKPKPTPN